MSTKNTLWFGLGGLLAVLVLPTVFVFILWIGEVDHLRFWWLVFASLIFAAAVSTPLYLMPAVPNAIAHIAVGVCLFPVIITVVMLGLAYIYEQAPMTSDAAAVKQVDYDVDGYEQVRPTGTSARVVNSTYRELEEADITAQYEETFKSIRALKGRVSEEELDERKIQNQARKDRRLAKLDILYPKQVKSAEVSDSPNATKSSVGAGADKSSNNLRIDASGTARQIERGVIWLATGGVALLVAGLVLLIMWFKIWRAKKDKFLLVIGGAVVTLFLISGSVWVGQFIHRHVQEDGGVIVLRT